ncbi:hypothetical protein Lal_00020397 [Lupinus albus]|uniref:Uncharacterized protein n=1 Tax=Lupinus albus TaxID=3870 RepID=A0A6A5MI31_LUPAL|nr:hypothetical protein Lalb_Chr08g0241981 [Lupinus albus]KAF1871603.1 hypothetical protein Lal_00020397 [Lupinus albus]
MIKGRETKAAPSTDLLVCFPSRAHLSLMPKPICSPARPSEPNKLGRYHRRKRSVSKGGGGGQAASPILWAKSTKSMGSEISEPTSPKVTCAGQIKVRPKTNDCRNWQSVMEEIEKIHNDKKQKKRLNWVETLGFKKEVMQFLTCLRSIRFDLRCFGSFPGTDIATEDDDEEDEDDDVEDEEGCHESDVKVEECHENETSRTVFSKWFMVLQENNQNSELKEKDKVTKDDETISENNVPPPNALLLMRCRSAPAKSWLKEESEGGGDNHEEKENEEHEQKEKEKVEVKVLKKGQSLKSLMEKEKRNNDNNLVVMQYDNDFYELSSDIAKETWIVGDLRDSLSRSRSWKR